MRYVADGKEILEIEFNFGLISPLPGYPNATLIDKDENVITVTPAQVSINDSDVWVSTITIPSISSNQQEIWTIRWTLVEEGRQATFDVPIYINPDTDQSTGDIVLLPNQPLEFNVPLILNSMLVQIYKNNELILDLDGVLDTYLDYTKVSVPLDIEPSIFSYLVIAKSSSSMLMFNLWVVTPRILTASLTVESWINKARVQQVIPSLEYKQSDLLNYLERGLNLFNSYGSQLTDFNGKNMQGPIYECWILCTTYYALGAQLQAEGALAFDFSGQAVTLNVDRTGQIEGALGRVESLINDKVPQVKKLLVKYGITGGDGSQSMSKFNPVGIGRLGVTNSASNVGNVGNFGQQLRRIY